MSQTVLRGIHAKLLGGWGWLCSWVSWSQPRLTQLRAGQDIPGAGQDIPGVGQNIPGVGQDIPEAAKDTSGRGSDATRDGSL